MVRSRLLRAVSGIIAALLVATACGGGSEPVDDGRLAAAADAAVVNATQLRLTAELDTTEMLDVRTGEIQSLDDVVTGDRAVLLWYWAPD